jgi:hypothetical protein
VVTEGAWLAYYAHVSAAVDNDSVFERIVTECWRLGEGAAAALLLPQGSAAAATIARVARTGRPDGSARTSAPSAASSRGAPTTHVAVIVTHGDGRRSLERVAADAFLDPADEEAVLARLAATGVEDAVGVSRDF